MTTGDCLDRQHPTLDQLNTGQAQGFAQAAVKGRTVEQELDVLRVLLAVPVHLPLRGQRRLRQRLLQSGAAQRLQHPLGNTFKGGKTPPFADQRNGIPQSSQPQCYCRARGPGAQDDDRGHGPIRRSGPR
ncbi:hypothetical protein D3C76_672240 [compost metagenome]